MPIYAYRCESCGHSQDVLQKLADAPLTICPHCGAPAFKKQVTAAGFRLKGSGWYATDFRDGDAGKANGKTDGKEQGKADGAGGSNGSSDAAATAAPSGSAGANGAAAGDKAGAGAATGAPASSAPAGGTDTKT